jgi:hypothetical protein
MSSFVAGVARRRGGGQARRALGVVLASACYAPGSMAAEPVAIWYRSGEGCPDGATNDLKWHCYADRKGDLGCPSERPVSGASCVGSFGAECLYPERAECTCSEEAGWACTEQARPDYHAPPSTPEPAKLILDLTATERQAWCTWYATAALGPGYPLASDAPVNDAGYTEGNACRYGDAFPCQARIPELSVAQCVANLELSSCAAPLAELEDCVVTVYDQCWPAPRGCARYTERPDCLGTIVAAAPEGAEGLGNLESSCQVRVR